MMIILYISKKIEIRLRRGKLSENYIAIKIHKLRLIIYYSFITKYFLYYLS